jgi:hypothetical protein
MMRAGPGETGTERASIARVIKCQKGIRWMPWR